MDTKYPEWLLEMYERYYNELEPGEESLSLDEYADCLGFKKQEPTK